MMTEISLFLESYYPERYRASRYERLLTESPFRDESYHPEDDRVARKVRRRRKVYRRLYFRDAYLVQRGQPSPGGFPTFEFRPLSYPVGTVVILEDRLWKVIGVSRRFAFDQRSRLPKPPPIVSPPPPPPLAKQKQSKSRCRSEEVLAFLRQEQRRARPRLMSSQLFRMGRRRQQHHRVFRG